MTLIPQTECCTMLGIDPKTVRRWVKQAQVSFVAHPSDARCACLTLEHVEHLALLHARGLSSQPQACAPTLPAHVPFREPVGACSAPSAQERKGEQATGLVPAADQPQTNAMKQLAAVMATMSTLQEQVAHLALTVLAERSQRYEQRLAVLEALLPKPLQALAALFAGGQPTVATAAPSSLPEPAPLPAEQRARSRPPLIEFGARGTYVIIQGPKGELPFLPDSPEWFAWLATLTSFRFVGQFGRFTAYRRYDRHGFPNRSWCAVRSLHGHRYEQSIGVTEHVTIARLEQAAATLQAQLDER